MALKIFFLLFIIFAYSFGLRSEQFNKLGVLKSKKTKLQCQDNSSVGKGFGQKVIKPAQGTTQKTEKSLMMYTCKKCNFRNAQMVINKNFCGILKIFFDTFHILFFFLICDAGLIVIV
jgi:hypothetical protein